MTQEEIDNLKSQPNIILLEHRMHRVVGKPGWKQKISIGWDHNEHELSLVTISNPDLQYDTPYTEIFPEMKVVLNSDHSSYERVFEIIADDRNENISLKELHGIPESPQKLIVKCT